MSDVKRLITGIIMVAIGIAMLFSTNGILPILGAIIGVIGAGIVTFVITLGNL